MSEQPPKKTFSKTIVSKPENSRLPTIVKERTHEQKAKRSEKRTALPQHDFSIFLASNLISLLVISLFPRCAEEFRTELPFLFQIYTMQGFVVKQMDAIHLKVKYLVLTVKPICS